MSNPIILLVGQANSGKDTAARLLQEGHYAAIVSHSDPMKRFCKSAFGFTDEQLWGESQFRNPPDRRLSERSFWDGIEHKLDTAFDLHLAALFNEPNTSPKALLRDFVKLWKAKIYDGGVSPRFVLQTLGTEYGRALNQDAWSEYAIGTAYKLLKGKYTYDKTVGLVDTQHNGFPYVVITDGRFRNEIINIKQAGGKIIKLENPEESAVKSHQSETEQTRIPETFYDAVVVNDKKNGIDTFKYLLDEVMTTIFPIPEIYQSIQTLKE